MQKLVFVALSGLVLSLGATAQDAEEEPEKKWSGEGSLSAGISTGNTETVDLGLALNFQRTAGAWKFSAEGSYDYGEVDGLEARNRYFVAGQADRSFGERFYAFGRVSYEEDDFSGFASRLFAGVGAGYHIFKRDNLIWDVEVAPGFRIDETADVIDPDTGLVTEPGESIERVGVRGASRFSYDFNERVGLTNNTGVTWSSETTQIQNTIALDSSLTDALTARISFEVRHDTNPPTGFESTDTATRLSIVYGF